MNEPVTGPADVAGLLASWLPRQRWFAAGPGGVTFAPAGQITLASAPGALTLASAGQITLATPASVGIVVHIISALPAGSVPEPGGTTPARPGSPFEAATYQVP